MRTSRALAVAALLAGAWWAGPAVPAVSASGGSSSCAGGTVVTEILHAPGSAASGTTFKVRIALRNCTTIRQSINLEGRLTAPAPCFAPAVDPLPLTLQPHQRYSTYYALQTSCKGTYSVEVKVAQGSTVLADQTVHISIT